jgi:hypothetical protein
MPAGGKKSADSPHFTFEIYVKKERKIYGKRI